MSDNAIIKRGIQIESPIDLFKILKKYPYLCKNELKNFRDIYQLSLTGCSCDRESNIRISNKVYQSLNKITKTIKIEFKNTLEVDFISFKFNGEEIFRW